MNKRITIGIVVAFLIGISILVSRSQARTSLGQQTDVPNNQTHEGPVATEPHELSIPSLRNGTYPGSDIATELTLADGSNYSRSIVSYTSEGNKIQALLTVPKGTQPETGWPAIIFNHGYIPPAQYKTTERYIAYMDAFSRNGYIVLKPDYRGHGNSEGQPSGAYGSNGYTIDVLNAVSSIKKYGSADPDRIGMWGHSMGGFITLRVMVASQDVKAGVIWGGVVASYPDLINRWRRGTGTPTASTSSPSGARRWRAELTERFGTPESNPEFWNSISANSYLSDISGPLQLQHGTRDASVPVAFSETLHAQIQAVGKVSELFTYQGDDHNISQSLSPALTRSVRFFDTYLKGGE